MRFEPAGVEVTVPEGTRLVDVTDEHPETAVPYSCRAANCGTCRVEVIEGASALAPPGDEEEELLEILREAPRVRLCCQLRVQHESDEVVVLRVLGDD